MTLGTVAAWRSVIPAEPQAWQWSTRSQSHTGELGHQPSGGCSEMDRFSQRPNQRQDRQTQADLTLGLWGLGS